MRLILLFTITFSAATVFAQTPAIDSLKRIVALQKHDTVELEALLNLSNEFLRRDLYLTKQYSYKVVALADTPPEVKWLSGAYNYLISAYQLTGGLDSAMYFVGLSEKLMQENPGNLRMRYNHNQALGLFYKNRGDYKKALPYMLENIRIWTKQDENKAGQLLNLGNLYFNMGDFKKAADCHLQALRLFETLKNQRGQSFCLQSLGNDFFNLNQLISAKQYFEHSLQLKEQLGDKRGSLNSTISLGDVYREMNDYQKSEINYQQALAVTRTLKLPIEEARVLHQSGLLYKKMRAIEQARNVFSQSLALYKQLGDSVSLVKTRSELLNLDVAEQNNKKIETQMLNGLNTLIRSGDRQQEAIEYLRLSEYYDQNKQFEKALYYLKKHEALSDSVGGNAVLLQLKELEEKYNNDKHEQEIALLKKEQELSRAEVARHQANQIGIGIALVSVIVIALLLVNRYRVVNRSRRIIELERIRNHIARDLHDDIGSTLSSIHIMSQLALKENGDAGTQLKKIATHSARIMENMSDIVWSINPGNDSLEQMTAKMKEFAAEILEPKEIEYTFDVDPKSTQLDIDLQKRKNIFLIFKEAVNNAAKYSEASKLHVHLWRENGSLNLSVADDGHGFDHATVQQGNGLRNMADRAQSMKARLVQTSAPGKGSSVSLSVPVT